MMIGRSKSSRVSYVTKRDQLLTRHHVPTSKTSRSIRIRHLGRSSITCWLLVLVYRHPVGPCFPIFWAIFHIFSRFVGFASILILFPRLLVFLAEVGRSKPDTALTPLESFLALHFGIFLISVSTSIVLNTQAANAPVPSQTPGINHALLVPISCGSVLSAFLAYNAHKIGTACDSSCATRLAYSHITGPLSDIVFFITGLIGVFGLWTVSDFSNS